MGKSNPKHRSGNRGPRPGEPAFTLQDGDKYFIHKARGFTRKKTSAKKLTYAQAVDEQRSWGGEIIPIPNP